MTIDLWGGEGEMDSRVRSGGSVPNKPLRELKWPQKWLKSNFWPSGKSDLENDPFLGKESLSFYREAESHFWVTFGVTLIIWGFGGVSKEHGGSQLQTLTSLIGASFPTDP